MTPGGDASCKAGAKCVRVEKTPAFSADRAHSNAVGSLPGSSFRFR